MYGYSDINIGDTVWTHDGTVGKVISLSSVSKLNHLAAKDEKGGFARIMQYGVQDDEVRHAGRMYWTIELLVRPTGSVPHIEAIDFQDVVRVEKPGVGFWTKLLALFK